MGIDTAWFKRKIEESEHGSMRKLAEAMRLDVGGLSRRLSGEREMGLADVRMLADLLRVPMGEVIRRAGVPFGVRDNVERRADRRSVES